METTTPTLAERILGSGYEVTSTVRAYGDIDDGALRQITTCLEVEHGARGVLCADHHLGYSMPIGGVVAYRDFVSPSAVGYDIACGNAALCLGVPWKDLAPTYHHGVVIGQHIVREISFGVGRRNRETVSSPVLDVIARSEIPTVRGLVDKASTQFGTVGSGNHYVDVFEDDHGLAWIGVHFGSRGFGYLIAQHYLRAAGATSNDMMAPPSVLPSTSALGSEYISAMHVAGRYAYEAREWVLRRVAEVILGTGAEAVWREASQFTTLPDGTTPAAAGALVHNHHNYAWTEWHGDRVWFVHRKGATPAWPGQMGFVGATMGEPAAIVVGLDTVESKSALRSTVHGAGRVMSRREAAGKTRVQKTWRCACGHNDGAGNWPKITWPGRAGEGPTCPSCGATMYAYRGTRVVTPGRVDMAAVRASMKNQGVVLIGAGADEAPECYKRLDTVLAAHGDAIRTVLRLHPRIVCMASSDEADPYKD